MKLPAFGLGTWQLGGATQLGGRQTGWGALEDDQARAIIAAALDHDIRLFDTADAYGLGMSETRLGHCLRAQDVVIVSKFGQRQDGPDFSTSWLQQAVEGSLKRLQRDRIDVLLMHSPPDDFDWTRIDHDAFESLVRAGKIGTYGVSARSRHGAKRALESGFPKVLEVTYHAFDRRLETEVFPLAQSLNVAIVARSVLAFGFLAQAHQQFEATDHRHYFAPELVSWLHAARKRLAWFDDLPGGAGVSALRFAHSHPAVACVLLGVRKPEQISALVQAQAAGDLSQSELLRISECLPDTYAGWA